MTESTIIKFDLSNELTKEELESFKKRAEEAGAKSLTEHLINITLKKEVA